MKGLIIGGEFGKLVMRKKSDSPLELGELLICEGSKKILLQVVNLLYGSQISSQNLELISGMRLEEDTQVDFMDEKLRNYELALLKSLLTISDKPRSCKSLPEFFNSVRKVRKEDLSFLVKPPNPLYLGNLRSGSEVLDLPIFLDGRKALSHHVLISATTGKGKSNLCSVMLSKLTSENYCGLLVLDPHDEYYGRTGRGLKELGAAYYSPKPPAGGLTLRIDLTKIKPVHLNGVVSWTTAQSDAISAYFRQYGKNWISAVMTDQQIGGNFQEHTVGVLKRRLGLLLNLDSHEGELICSGIFSMTAGSSTISDIVGALENSKTVIVDTSEFSGSQEILIGSLISNEILSKYKKYMQTGELKSKPVISILIEEAPRVLGKEVLEQGSNIFSTIAREGRKFNVGLIAVTQMPSLIPRQVLANMNTKIILGTEMKPERQALIESAAQDLSDDDQAIASLDKGEAIVTSNFARFALPIYVPLFSSIESMPSVKMGFSGVQ